jgi:uncharacterized membrane protein
MTETTQFAPEPTLFEVRLKPHRSLSRAGFLAVMAVLAGASFAAGIAFLMMGAWPVFGFFGLDVLLVWIAFRANFRSARAFEDIHVTPSRLSVRQVSPRGGARDSEFNPRGVRSETARDEDYGVTRLALVSRGVPLEIGAFLGPRQREHVAQRLTAAIAIAKR